MKETRKMLFTKPHMIAHRGLSGLERENTNAAFIAAGNRSYYGIETDIHRTKDSQYIIYHDDNLIRLMGDERIVEEMTFDELRALRLKDYDGIAREDLVLPSLTDYIRICRKYEKVSVLEIKNHFESEDIQNVIEIIREMDWLEKTIFISFDLPNCLYIREKLPEQRIQYLVKEYNEDILAVLRENKLDLDIYYGNCTKRAVDACHAIGAVVNVWTVDDLDDAYKMVLSGVDFITTNIIE